MKSLSGTVAEYEVASIVHETPSADGRADLTFHVRTGPRVETAFAGARGRAALRQEIEPYWQKGLFMEDIVEQARARIETVFRDRGYLKVAVAAEIVRRDPEVVRVRFSVRRGPRRTWNQAYCLTATAPARTTAWGR